MRTIIPPSGQSSCSSDALQELARQLHPGDWGIVPFGHVGALLWNRLPIHVARLLRPPQHHATNILPDGKSHDSTGIWDAILLADLSSIEILPLADWASHACDPFVLPSLAPRRSSGSPVVKQLTIGSGPDATALRAGLLQFWDDLHKSHEQSQSIEGEGLNGAGDYWHAIMHRREPDYGNSKYWFRNVGEHPIFPELAEQAASVLSQPTIPEVGSWLKRLTGRGWDPMAFVDLCQHVARQEDSPLGIAARTIQLIEMILLMESTLADALTG